MMTDQTGRLIKDIQRGVDKERAYQELFRIYDPPISRFFLRKGISFSEVDDLVQEVFVHVFNGIKFYRGEASFETWLFQIVGNVWRNAVRLQHSQKRYGEEISLDGLSVVDRDLLTADLLTANSAVDPLREVLGREREALERERRRMLRQAIAELPPQMRRIMLLRTQGLKYREIAESLNIAINTVKAKLHEARSRLVEKMQDSKV